MLVKTIVPYGWCHVDYLEKYEINGYKKGFTTFSNIDILMSVYNTRKITELKYCTCNEMYLVFIFITRCVMLFIFRGHRHWDTVMDRKCFRRRTQFSSSKGFISNCPTQVQLVNRGKECLNCMRTIHCRLYKSF